MSRGRLGLARRATRPRRWTELVDAVYAERRETLTAMVGLDALGTLAGHDAVRGLRRRAGAGTG